MGHSAKYGTYTLFANNICRILSFRTIVVRPMTRYKWYNNCLSCLWRYPHFSLSHRKPKWQVATLWNSRAASNMFTGSRLGLYSNVYSFVTDRRMSIGKWMREESSDIIHLFDGWYSVKGNFWQNSHDFLDLHVHVMMQYSPVIQWPVISGNGLRKKLETAAKLKRCALLVIGYNQ